MSQEKKNTDRLKDIAKIPSNKKCIDCGTPGIQANVVLAPYNIFVCQTCAGLHRNFTHKVKGISMSKFTTEEVDQVEAGGNKRAAATWLAKFDESKFPFKSSDINKVKEKIERTYEKKEWYDEKGKKKTKPKPSAGKHNSSSNSGDVEENSQENESEGSKSKKAPPSKTAKVVKVVNEPDLLGGFDPIEEKHQPAKKPANSDNPFLDEEEEEEDTQEEPEPEEDPEPGVQTPDLILTDIIAPTTNTASKAKVDTNAPPEQQAVQIIAQTLREVGIKYKFPKDKMIGIVDQAMKQVGLTPSGGIMPPMSVSPAPMPMVNIAPMSEPVNRPPKHIAPIAVDNPFASDDESPSGGGNDFFSVLGNPTQPAQALGPFGGSSAGTKGPITAPFSTGAIGNPAIYGQNPAFGNPAAYPKTAPGPAYAQPYPAGAIPGYPVAAMPGYGPAPAYYAPGPVAANPMAGYPSAFSPAVAPTPATTAAAPTVTQPHPNKDRDLFKDLGPLFG